ncbi:Ig-like domain-containing protein [Rhodococcus sp. BH2-1]|nr:Ig-like domain-containing protein [Rhodococcus sp. BH2-1]
MNLRLYRWLTPIVVGATAAAGATVLAATAASAESSTVTFNNACRATPSSSLAGGPQDQVQEASVTVDAPASVAPGDEFDVLITPPPISIPNDAGSGATLTNVSRLKIDVEMPQNAQYLGGDVVPGTGFGLSGVAPNVLVVNEQGFEDPDGEIIRLSGANQTIGNGPNSAKKAEGGIKVDATSGAATTFQLPQVRARLKAAATGAVQLKLRTAGAAGNFADDANFMTFLPKVKAPIIGAVWAPTQCSPRDTATGPLNAGSHPLATTHILGEAADTTTHVSGPSAVAAGSEFTLQATVVPTPDGGRVQFTRNGEDLGVPVEVLNGKASLTQLIDVNGSYQFTAKFLGTETHSASASTPHTVTVTDDRPGDSGSLNSLSRLAGSLGS